VGKSSPRVDDIPVETTRPPIVCLIDQAFGDL
jgi:hypothetical protein